MRPNEKPRADEPQVAHEWVADGQAYRVLEDGTAQMQADVGQWISIKSWLTIGTSTIFCAFTAELARVAAAPYQRGAEEAAGIFARVFGEQIAKGVVGGVKEAMDAKARAIGLETADQLPDIGRAELVTKLQYAVAHLELATFDHVEQARLHLLRLVGRLDPEAARAMGEPSKVLSAWHPYPTEQPKREGLYLVRWVRPGSTEAQTELARWAWNGESFFDRIGGFDIRTPAPIVAWAEVPR